jgi:hypothetical protein
VFGSAIEFVRFALTHTSGADIVLDQDNAIDDLFFRPSFDDYWRASLTLVELSGGVSDVY